MARFDNRMSVLLVAALVVLATVPVGPLHAGAAAPESVESDSVSQAPVALQETPENETTTPDETDRSHAVAPLRLPTRPDSPSESNVVRYVVAYEEARKHNEILAETTDVSITDIHAFCSPSSLDEQSDGFAVEVACGFSYEFGENGTSTGIADGAPYMARYLVDENATELRGMWSAIGSGEAIPLPAPTRPDSLTDVSAAAYAANYEEVRKYNALLNETDATVTRADVYCEFDRGEERDDDFVVDLACVFSYDFRTEDGTVGVANGPPYTARYRIDETSTELVRVEAVGGNATTAPTGAETTTPSENATTTSAPV